MPKNDKWPCGTRLYQIWAGMVERCYKEYSRVYSHYGGRGIKVCDEWRHNFYVFEKWAYDNGYREYLTLDRINNDGDYSPDNCRWATQLEQMRNTSKSIFVEIDGEVKPLVEWAESANLNPTTVRVRYHKGDRGKRLLRPLKKEPKPKRNLRRFTIDGISKTAREWSAEIGVDVSTFNVRYRNGDRGADLIRPPKTKRIEKERVKHD